MLKNYLKIALRTLRKHPGYTSINVAGLAVGLACCILIFLFVRDEVSYDEFHAKADQIYRVVNERHAEGGKTDRAVTPPALGPTLVDEFPDVQQAVRFFGFSGQLVQYEDHQFFEDHFFLADSTVFEVFSFSLIQGDPATALTAPYSLVLTEDAAETYFGEENPIGKTLRVANRYDFQVTGVMENVPRQSHLKINVLGSFSTMKDFVSEERLSNWIWQQFYTYIQLPEDHSAAQLEAKLPAFIAQHATPETSSRGFTYEPYLQPLRDIYLNSSHLQFDTTPRGNITYVYAFSFIAVFILLIACFNFMNLSTARSMQRAKEVGMRKVIGAQRGQLVRQFLGESVLLAVLALGLAILLVHLVLPAFNAFAGKSIAIDYADDLGLVMGVIAGSVFVGLLAGSYPAFFLSAFKPISVLKGTTPSSGAGLSSLRRGLVTAQFAISMLLIIGTAFVYRQLQYVQNKHLGFEEEQVVVLPIRGDQMEDNLDALKAELLGHASITSVAASWGIPGEFAAGDDIRLPGSDGTWPTNMFTVDHDFIGTFQMELVAGRDFSRDFPSDESEAFVLNETAARDLGWTPEEAIGKEIWWDVWGEEALKKGSVIGVVADFHYRSLHQSIEPLVMHIFRPAFGYVSVRIRPDNISDALDFLEATWGTWAPAWPFEYDFLDDDIADEYEAEQKLGQVAATFSMLAMLIACLGLLGLAAYMAERRTKEIGVRKVLGATIPSIVALLSKEFVRLVLVAFVIAVPLAYVVVDRWLTNFAYRIELSWWIFGAAGAAALLVAWLTVSYQSIKAALANPVDSLRYE